MPLFMYSLAVCLNLHLRNMWHFVNSAYLLFHQEVDVMIDVCLNFQALSAPREARAL